MTILVHSTFAKVSILFLFTSLFQSASGTNPFLLTRSKSKNLNKVLNVAIVNAEYGLIEQIIEAYNDDTVSASDLPISIILDSIALQLMTMDNFHSKMKLLNFIKKILDAGLVKLIDFSKESFYKDRFVTIKLLESALRLLDQDFPSIRDNIDRSVALDDNIMINYWILASKDRLPYMERWRYARILFEHHLSKYKIEPILFLLNHSQPIMGISRFDASSIVLEIVVSKRFSIPDLALIMQIIGENHDSNLKLLSTTFITSIFKNDIVGLFLIETFAKSSGLILSDSLKFLETAIDTNNPEILYYLLLNVMDSDVLSTVLIKTAQKRNLNLAKYALSHVLHELKHCLLKERPQASLVLSSDDIDHHRLVNRCTNLSPDRFEIPKRCEKYNSSSSSSNINKNERPKCDRNPLTISVNKTPENKNQSKISKLIQSVSIFTYLVSIEGWCDGVGLVFTLSRFNPDMEEFLSKFFSSALRGACFAEHTEMIEYLVRNSSIFVPPSGDHVLATEVELATAVGNLKLLKLLLQDGSVLESSLQYNQYMEIFVNIAINCGDPNCLALYFQRWGFKNVGLYLFFTAKTAVSTKDVLKSVTTIFLAIPSQWTELVIFYFLPILANYGFPDSLEYVLFRLNSILLDRLSPRIINFKNSNSSSHSTFTGNQFVTPNSYPPPFPSYHPSEATIMSPLPREVSEFSYASLGHQNSQYTDSTYPQIISNSQKISRANEEGKFIPDLTDEMMRMLNEPIWTLILAPETILKWEINDLRCLQILLGHVSLSCLLKIRRDNSPHINKITLNRALKMKKHAAY